MGALLRRPSSALAPFVELLWHFDEPVPDGFERKLPTGGMQIVVNLAADELRWYDGDRLDRVHTAGGAALSGPVTEAFGIDTAEQRWSVGVAFRPGGVAPFFTPPAIALADPLVELGDLWGRPGALLRERLLHEASPAAMLTTLELCLLEQVVRPFTPDRALDAAVTMVERGWPVHRIVDRVGTTPATLGRMFRRLVGLSPKPYARVRRLQRVLTSVTTPATAAGPPTDWATIAYEHGYYDQAHLINEFRALTGTTPSAYRPRSSAERNHVPVPG